MGIAMASLLIANVTYQVPHILFSTRGHPAALPILQLSPCQLGESVSLQLQSEKWKGQQGQNWKHALFQMSLNFIFIFGQIDETQLDPRIEISCVHEGDSMIGMATWQKREYSF